MKDCKIIIFTPNPALDVYYISDNGESLGKEVGRSSAGKGVNLARTLATLEVKSLCYLALGEENLGEYLWGLDGCDSVSYEYVALPGRTRENKHIRHPYGERVISGEGIALSGEAIGRIFDRLATVLGDGDVFCLSGSIPDGTDKAVLLDRMSDFRARGVRLAVDSRSLSAVEMKKIHPWIIKPNREEAEALLADLGAESGEMDTLRSLAEKVIVTLGGEGALLLGEGDLLAEAPRVEARSTVGAGDSALAGFISAKLAGESDSCALRLSVACGSASCISAGTVPPDPCEIKRLYKDIDVK